MSSIEEMLSEDGELATFLRTQKERFFKDVRSGRGNKWTVVVGNRAGDLDTITCANALSYLSHLDGDPNAVPICLTPRSDMHLRPENEFALRHCKVPSDVIIHSDTLPDGLTIQDLIAQDVNFALVDQNTLPPGFGGGTVKLIIDHHKDEDLHLDADRFIEPAASCASLVWDRFKSRLEAKGIALSAVPSGLKVMLLAAIGVDTDNWKEGKATEIDYKSTFSLIPLSTFKSPADDTAGDAMSIRSTPGIPQDLSKFTERLIKEKSNVNGLSNYDLLRRDHKEFQTESEFGSLRIGVPVFTRSVMKAASREPEGLKSFMGVVDKFMRHRGLDGLCALTSLLDDSEGKPKRRREILVVAKSRQDGAIRTSGEAKSVCEYIMDGLYRDGPLCMKDWEGLVESVEALSNGTEGLVGVVAEQGNLGPTRKHVMPLLQGLIGGLKRDDLI